MLTVSISDQQFFQVVKMLIQESVFMPDLMILTLLSPL